MERANKLLLILTPSYLELPCVLAFDVFSLPAKSTRFIIENFFVPGLEADLISNYILKFS